MLEITQNRLFGNIMAYGFIAYVVWQTVIFTHTPCGSMGQQMDIFSLSFFSTPLTFCLSLVQKMPWGGGVGPSLWCNLVGVETPSGT